MKSLPNSQMNKHKVPENTLKIQNKNPKNNDLLKKKEHQVSPNSHGMLNMFQLGIKSTNSGWCYGWVGVCETHFE